MLEFKVEINDFYCFGVFKWEYMYVFVCLCLCVCLRVVVDINRYIKIILFIVFFFYSLFRYVVNYVIFNEFIYNGLKLYFKGGKIVGRVERDVISIVLFLFYRFLNFFLFKVRSIFGVRLLD